MRYSVIGPFVFTMSLLPLMEATAKEPGSDVRIVNVRLPKHFLFWSLMDIPLGFCPMGLCSCLRKQFEALGVGYDLETVRISMMNMPNHGHPHLLATVRSILVSARISRTSEAIKSAQLHSPNQNCNRAVHEGAPAKTEQRRPEYHRTLSSPRDSQHW